ASAAGGTSVVLHPARTRAPRAPAPLSQDVRPLVLCLDGVPSLARRAHRSPHRPLRAARIGPSVRIPPTRTQSTGVRDDRSLPCRGTVPTCPTGPVLNQFG